MKLISKIAVPLFLLLFFIVGCQDPTTGKIGENNGVTEATIRPLDQSVWSRKSISYSGYRTDQEPGSSYPSEAEIKEDMELLLAQDFGLLRMYDTGTHAQRVLKVIQDNSYNIKIQLGIYIRGDITKEENYELLDQAVEYANNYSDIIASVSVGNETLVYWSFIPVEPEDIIEYIRYVRSNITQPVTVNDDNTAFANKAGSINQGNKDVWKEVDYVAIHSYAYWDAVYGAWDIKFTETPEADRAKAMMDYALEYAKSDFAGVRKGLNDQGLTYVPIIIGETGWQSLPTGKADGTPPPNAVLNASKYMAHEVNSAMYYNSMMEWTFGPNGDDPGDGFDRPASMFYFEAFDEPWKKGDDNWGLWDVERNPKYVLTGLGYTLDDAVYYIAPEDQDPPEAGIEITESSFILYRDLAVAEGEESYETQWNSWEGDTTATISTIETGSPEGTTHGEITPTPETWGWGMTLIPKQPESTSEAPVLMNLSAFTTNGELRFKIKTTYESPLEIGFSTGHADTSDGVDAYIKVDPADNSYGYNNNGIWNDVVIPIEHITPNATPAYGMNSSAELDMERVLSLFVIADRFTETGNSEKNTSQIEIDDISWNIITE